MRHLKSRHLCVAGLAVLVAGALLLYCRFASPPGFDGGWPAGVNDEIEREAQRQARLEGEQRLLQQAHAARIAIVTEVIARRITLRDAAVQFRDIDTALPAHLTVRLEAYPGPTEEDRMARCVLAYVAREMSDRPGRDTLIARLEAEWEHDRLSQRNQSSPPLHPLPFLSHIPWPLRR